MAYNENKLRIAYCAAVADCEEDEIESYQEWLVRQFICRLNRIDELEKELSDDKLKQLVEEDSDGIE